MKILIDLQAVQGINSYRGIGRASLSLAKAIAKIDHNHSVHIALNSCFPSAIDKITDEFSNLIEEDHIHVWCSLENVSSSNSSNLWRTTAAELIRERSLADISPDIIHVSSMFEGWIDDSVTSTGALSPFLPTAVTLYDLIPYLYMDHYLHDPGMRDWYMRKLSGLKYADCLLSISESSKREALDIPLFFGSDITSISLDADKIFRQLDIHPGVINDIKNRLGVEREIILYTGGIDKRKNIPGLIEAYAALPGKLRKHHQLVVVCEIVDEVRDSLLHHARKMGLSKNELILTGYVSDDDLVALYNLCRLFVFPPLHEGFGLPLLEAMRCGAVAIGSDCSSIPEVLGFKEALFDPHSRKSISSKIYEGLTDEGFRQRFINHAKQQVQNFSWEASAKKSIDAFESLHEKRQAISKVQLCVSTEKKKKLAYFSPLPPERSGIADFSAELLPELAVYYDIDLITDLDEISDPWLSANFRNYNISEFKSRAGMYDRILYHIGNSEFHTHMIPLLHQYPGTVILHDFFLSGIQHYLLSITGDVTEFKHQLYYSHGYSAVKNYTEDGFESTLWEYPGNRQVIEDAQGVIVHSDHAINLAKSWCDTTLVEDWQMVPLPRQIPVGRPRTTARSRIEVDENTFVVCSFGILAETKMNQHLLDAWLSSSLAANKNCLLIYVGFGGENPYISELKETIAKSPYGKRIRITGYVDAEKFKDYLAACDMAVQLRSRSRGETSISVLDAMSHGIPTIINAHGSFAEIPGDKVYVLPDIFNTEDLANALEKLYSDEAYRSALGEEAKTYVREHHSPALSAKEYFRRIEYFASHHYIAKRMQLINKVTSIDNGKPSEFDLQKVALAVRENEKKAFSKQIFVDISMLVKCDKKTGIERVTSNILSQLLADPPQGYRVEPVYRLEGMYRYAQKFTGHFMGLGELDLGDEPLDIGCEDILLCPELDGYIDESTIKYLKSYGNRGLKIYFLVHDLLPILKPEYFPEGMYNLFTSWLDNIINLADGLICVSESVADELREWLTKKYVEQFSAPCIGYFHHGGDIFPLNGNDEDPGTLLPDVLKGKDFILMVGTVEPRKGYLKSIEAMEHFWRNNENVSLVIVGKEGWKTDGFCDLIREHPEAGTKLFWFEDVSDVLLSELYDRALVLLMASFGEGFGLPLIEAAKHNLPIIARDLPVFREVAGAGAYYFSSDNPISMSDSISSWLDLYRLQMHPDVSRVNPLSWRESKDALMDVILNNKWKYEHM